MIFKRLKYNFGLFNSIKSSFDKVKEIGIAINTPVSSKGGLIPNTNLVFEEVAQEYIANYTSSTYEVSNT